MMYPYMTLADGTEVVHSHVILKEGVESVEVNFERPTEEGFDSARCELPGYKVYFWSNENGEPIHVHISKGTSQ